MEDRDTGVRAPEAGMSSDVSASDAPQAAPVGPTPNRQGADSHGAGRAAEAAPSQGKGPLQGKGRKRRKRRRGRKVFARTDPAGPVVANANGASSPAVASLPPASARDPHAPSPHIPPHPIPGHRAPEAAPSVSAARVAPPPRRHAAPDLPVFAALDLGTNNCRLLVAVPTRHGQFRVIDAFSRIVRLGEGLASTGRLGQPAMDRAVEALKVCADKLGTRRVRKARLIATEACRAAENGAEFLERVEREAGLKLEIIDRQTEARLAVSGCGSLVERDTRGVVLFDIGGGSSEIALIDVSRHRTPRLANHIVSWTSLPVGVVSLAERFGGRNVTRAVFEAMVDEVARLLDRFEGRERLSHLASGARFHLLGTSGTVTTLAGVHLGLERYDRRRVDGLWMDNDHVDAMIARLLSWDFEQRVANPCIGADRADLVLAGCAILEAIRRHWPSQRLRVADRGLREGMLSELMADDGVWRRNRREGSSR